jgi:hypothetical protein
MTDLSLLNDPEYRWYHKEKMAKIMPFKSERDRLGIKVIDYTKLRHDYLLKIKEVKCHNLNWNLFKSLVESVPSSEYSSIKKIKISPKDMYHFERKDRCKCYLCETVSRFTQFHHRIPTGPVSDDNIVTLCISCHKMVHIALYSAGKRRGFY